jgi:hypothetical protein
VSSVALARSRLLWTVSIRTRQTKPEETVTTFYIEKLELDLGVLAMIGGDIALDPTPDRRRSPHRQHRAEKFGRGSIRAGLQVRTCPAPVCRWARCSVCR